ncbi:MAG: hypothetical protein NC123_20475 [Butyrivibrio sp.]|nr:hypothetical protein [Butyrivibrio sp.]
MHFKNHFRKPSADSRLFLTVILLFICSTIIRGFLSDFPKALRIYPDELRYVSIARSLFKGQGLRIHNINSDFQKILYSLCIMPAFIVKSSALQIRLIGCINSLLVSSSIFPVYALCRKMNLKTKDTALIAAFWFTLPTLLTSMSFMSEVIYLPLSLWLIYCVWTILCTDEFAPHIQIRLHITLGFLCYLAYLCKEISLYFILSYFFVCIIRIFVQPEARKKNLLYLLVFLGVFSLCFLGMKITVFQGLHNSYSSSNLANIQGIDFLQHFDKLRYLLYALTYDTLFAILSLGIFPVLFPLTVFDRNKKESWFYLFLLIAFLIGCATIAYTITLPEEFGKRSPRQHIRYLEPFAIPFYILMINVLNQAERRRIHFKILLSGVSLFIILFVVLGAGGGSSLVDNNMLVYYEFFARFISKSDQLLLCVRILMSIVIGTGLLLIYRDRGKFLHIFCILFIAVNLINSIAGYFAYTYRYTINKELRTQAADANDYLWTISGNILLITDEGWESEDSRLFDTYVTRDLYVAEIDQITVGGLLEDSILDLESEPLLCSFPYEYYSNLFEVDYLIVKEDYGIYFQPNSVEHMDHFPLTGYHLYKNLAPGKIYFADADFH